MKYLILLQFLIFVFYSNVALSNDQGIVNLFNQISVSDQDKKIENNFKQLHKMMAELGSIVKNIEKTKKQIIGLKRKLETKNDVCLALPLLKIDIDKMKKKLYKLKVNSEEYNKINKEYVVYKKAYDTEIKNIICK